MLIKYGANMVTKEQIDRINFLYHKSKTAEGLTRLFPGKPWRAFGILQRISIRHCGWKTSTRPVSCRTVRTWISVGTNAV